MSTTTTATVTVYSKPACVQCNATYRALKKADIEYTVIDVTEDQDAYNQVVAMGYQQVPVVVAGPDHWSGFRPDLIKTINKRAILPSDATREARSPAR